MLHCAMLSILCASAQNINDPPVIRSIGQAMAILRKPAATASEYDGLLNAGHARRNAMDFLRSSSKVSSTDLADLLEVVLPDRNNPSSRQILKLACQHADDVSALRIIQVMRVYGEQSLGVRPISKPARFADTRTVDDIAMRVFMIYSKALAQKMQNPRPLLNLFYDWLMIQQSVKWNFMRRAVAINLTAITLPVSLDLRREYTLKILGNYRLMPRFPLQMADLIDDSMWPQMRSLVEQSVDDPEVFPIAVARYFVDRGDMEILPFLNKIEAKTYPAEHLRNRQPEEVAGTLSWRIKIQHPPETLLKWLAMGPSPDFHDRYINEGTRMWMMEQAVGLGLEKQAIREAVLTYAGHYNSAGYPHSAELPGAKRRAVELGILQPGDLAEIKLRPVRNRAR